MRLGQSVAILAALLLWAGAAWAVETTDSASQERETYWQNTLKFAHNPDATTEQLRSFLETYLSTYTEPDDPHRALAKHLLDQLNNDVDVQDLDFKPPLPKNGVDIASLRFLFGKGVGAEADLIGLHRGLLRVDFLQGLVYFPRPSREIGLIASVGASAGVRIPLCKSESCNDELHIMGGLAWMGIQGIEDPYVFSLFAIPLELSYLHRFYEHLALQVGIKTLCAVPYLFPVAFGFVGLRF